MGLLLHQFRKDLRQTWIVWVLWLLFTGLQFALAAWNVGASDLAGQGVYAQLLGLVPTVHNLLLFVLVPLLLLQEPTVGTTAFWLTKPMPRGIVLGSKLLALLILVVVPLLGKCAVLASHGVVLRDVVLAGIEVGLHELGWITLITALAALSPSFGWFLVAAVAFLAFQFLSGWVLSWIAMLGAKKDIVVRDDARAYLWQSRAMAADLLRIAFALGVAVFQYLTRRTRAAIALGVAGLLAAFLAGSCWPWDFLGSGSKAPAAPAFDTSGITISVGGYHNLYEQPDWHGGPPRKTMNTAVSVAGLDAAHEISIVSEGGELALPGGAKLPLPTRFSGFNSNGPRTSAVDAAIGDLPILAPNPVSSDRNLFVSGLYSLDAPTFAKNAAVAGAASFRLRVSASHYRIAAELPLARGASFARGSDRTVVADILRGEGVDVIVRRRVVALHYFGMRPGLSDPVFVLVNRKRGEALVGQNANRFAGAGMFAQNAFLAGTLAFLGGGDDRIEIVTDSDYFFGPPQQWNPPRALPVPLDDAWMADASLVVLERMPDGEFPVTLSLPNFTLDGKSLPNNNGDGNVAPDKAALAAVVLPENPTRADVWRYLGRIDAITQRQQSYSSEDPQVEMLRRVGPAHAVELLIGVASTMNPYHLVEALKGMDLSGRADAREMTVRLLKQQPELIEVVTRNRWEAAAEPVLLARIRDLKTNDYRDEKWIPALASLRDPATRNNDFRHDQYLDYIRALPGPLVAGLTDRLWRKVRGTKDEKLFLGTAAGWGIADALDRSAEIVTQPADAADKEKTELRNRARDALRNATACPDRLLDGDLAAWYLANKAQLGFDPGLGRFLLHPAVLPPDWGWPKPADGMKVLGWRAAAGDATAIDEIDAALGRLAEGLDPKRDEARINGLRNLAWNAFNVLRDAAVDDPSVLSVLDYAAGKERLHGFVAWGYGKAAATGNAAALDTLVHYKDRGWTLPDVLNSLLEAVRKGNPAAVDFVLATYADPATGVLPEPKVVRTKLVSMIQDAANAGSDKAKTVYETIQK